jgi:hypothetical protein
MDLLTEKAVDRLASIARGEAPTLEAEDDGEDQPSPLENGEERKPELLENDGVADPIDTNEQQQNYMEEQVKDDE